jgi:hypothetical protein
MANTFACKKCGKPAVWLAQLGGDGDRPPGPGDTWLEEYRCDDHAADIAQKRRVSEVYGHDHE